ncbi:MAG: hypothetical protein GVY25_16655 [Bacteroidetes bacterium]|nr:hypothetical protein [Bacteroidota bacterium]
MNQLSDQVNEVSSQGRERAKAVLQLMLRWIRDLMLYRELGEEAPLVNVDQNEVIENFVRRVPDADLEAMIHLVEQAIHLAERNVRLSLVLTTLAHRLGDAMRGKGDTRLYVPMPDAETA